MNRVAVMGDYDSIYGFCTLGFDIFPIGEKKEAIHQMRRLVKGQYAIIYITESLAEIIGEELNQFMEHMIPAIILIPGVSGNTKAGIQGVKNSVEKAIGSDILFS